MKLLSLVALLLASTHAVSAHRAEYENSLAFEPQPPKVIASVAGAAARRAAVAPKPAVIVGSALASGLLAARNRAAAQQNAHTQQGGVRTIFGSSNDKKDTNVLPPVQVPGMLLSNRRGVPDGFRVKECHGIVHGCSHQDKAFFPKVSAEHWLRTRHEASESLAEQAKMLGANYVGDIQMEGNVFGANRERFFTTATGTAYTIEKDPSHRGVEGAGRGRRRSGRVSSFKKN